MTLLEAKYNGEVAKNLITPRSVDSEGIRLFDLDACKPIDNPEERGLSVDTDAIVDFLEDQDADPQHFRGSAIGLYGSESPLAVNKAGIPTRNGFVSKNTRLVSGLDYPMSLLLGLRYDPQESKEEIINATLRHEIGHLLYEDHTALYNNPDIVQRTRLGAGAVAATLTSAMPDIFTREWVRYQQVVEGMPAWGVVATFAGVSASALYAAAVTHNSKGLLNRIDKGERAANAFARKHKDFNPITFTSGAKNSA